MRRAGFCIIVLASTLWPAGCLLSDRPGKKKYYCYSYYIVVVTINILHDLEQD